MTSMGTEEPTGPVERLAYWSNRILTNEDDGALPSASASMDLDMSHDELTKAAREYLGLDESEMPPDRSWATTEFIRENPRRS